MTNPFLDEKAASQNNPFIGLDDGIEPVRPGPSVIAAQTYQPDAWAQARAKGQQLGVAPDVVARNPEEVRRLELTRSVDQVRQSNPALADWLLKDDNLTLAQDDTPSMLSLSDLITGKRPEPPVSGAQRVADYALAPQRGVNSALGGGTRGIGELIDSFAYGAARLYGGEEYAKRYMEESAQSAANPSELLKTFGSWIERGGVYQYLDTSRAGVENPFVPVTGNRRTTGISIAEGVGNFAGQAAVTVLNPTAGVGLLLGQGADQQAQMVQEAGKEGTAGGYAAIAASAPVSAVLEKIPLDFILRAAPPNVKNAAARWVLDKLIAGGVEGAQELGEQAAYNALAQGFYNPDQDVTEGLGENFTLGAAVGMIVRSTVRMPGLERGRQENEQVDALTQVVQASKLQQRDPQKMADAINTLKTEGVSTVYVPAEAVQTLFQSSPESVHAFQNAGIDQQAVLESLALKSDVAVPLETYLTQIAPQYHGELGKVARLSPDSVTDADPDARDEQDAAVERFLASVQDAPTEGQSDMRVYNDVMGQLVGTYSQGDAEQMATVVNAFFRDGIGRTGVDPYEAYQRYGLRIIDEVRRSQLGSRIAPEFDSLVERLRTGDIPNEDVALGPTIGEFLSERGIRSAPNEPMSGEIRKLAENDRFTRKGKQRLVREDDPNAMTLDYAREAAGEAGYLPEGSDINDLLNALENDARPLSPANPNALDVRNAAQQLSDELGRLGIDPGTATNEEIRKALFSPQGEATGDWANFDQGGIQPKVDMSPTVGSREVKIGDTTVIYGVGKDKTAEIISVRTPQAKRGAGSARAALEAVLSAADEAMLTVKLGASPLDKKTKLGKLVEFYKSLGFKTTGRTINQAGEPEMIREPSQERDEALNESSYRPSVVSWARTRFGDMIAPNGRPAWQNFVAWFGDSKVVDANGEPLVVYHGSPDARFMQDDATFMSIRDRYGSREGVGAFWFAKDRSTAVSYADDRRAFDYQNAEPGIVDAMLRLENPLVVDGKGQHWRDAQAVGKTTDVIEQAQADGHDGVIIRNVKDNYNTGPRTAATDTYVVFNSRQIKSAAANQGNFDGGDASILNQDRRGYLQFGQNRQFILGLTQAKDLSTFLHEFGHFGLEVMADMAAAGDPTISGEWQSLVNWWGENADDVIRTADPAMRDGLTQDLIRTVAADFKGDHGPQTVAARTALHEYFARGFEKYLAEGKPPSPELAGAFTRFKQWMKAIYKSLSGLNVNINDEVRGVFARMLAGDQAIVEAEQASVAEPLFKEAARAGMTDAQFAAYLELVKRGHDEAEARITAEAYKEVVREKQRWWREESKRVQEDVSAELYAEPVYKAWYALARNQNPDGTPLETPEVKLAKQWLLDKYGQEFLNKNLLRKQVYSADAGVHGDVVAPLFGFDSGSALVEALVNAKPLRQAIREETEARMRERHGDMRVDGTLAEKAAAAVHNNRRMKVIEAEIAALAQLAGQPAMTTQQARAWAKGRVDATRVREIQPIKYLRAERKAAREALKAAARGNHAEALDASRRRLANAVMYDEVVKARKAFDKRQAWIKRQTRSGTQEALGKAGVAFRDQFNAVLASLSVRPRTDAEVARQKPLSAWVESMAQAGMEVAVTDAVAARVDAGAFVNMRDMTVAEFTEAYEALKSIKHAAGNEKRLLTAEGVKFREDAITEMLGRAETALPKVREAPQNAFEGSAFQRARMGVREVLNSAEGPEAIIEMLDGDKAGPWRTYLWKPWQDAQNKLGRLRRKFVNAHNTLRKSLPDGFYQSLTENVTLPWGQEAARGTLLSMVLNTGTQSNIDRLKNGGVIYKGQPVTMTDADVQALRDLLTADEARYVQGLWDIAESNWPEMVKLQTDVTGIPPEKVQSVPSTANGVPLRGGYWMLVADSDKAMFGEQQEDSDALRAMMGNGVSRATTPKGQFKSRAENAKYPLKLDFGSVLARNLDNVFTDLSYRKAVIDITRLLHDQRVKDAIQTRVGKEAYRSLKGGLAYSVSAVEAAGNRAAVMNRFINKVTSNLSVAVLALRVPLALGNYGGGILQAVDRAGTRAVMRGMLEFNVNRGDVTEQIKSLSPYMANRLEDIDYQYRQELGKTQNERGYKAAFTRVMMAVHRIADNEVSRAAWWGQYKSLTDKGMSSAEAVQQADAMIRLTQTRSGKNEVSTIERDPRFTDAKQFMGPMFVMLSRLRAAATGEGSIRGVGARSASVFINIFLANAVFQALAGRLPDDDDDDGELSAEEWVLWFIKGGLFYPLQMLPYVREFGAGIEAWSSDKPINPRAAPTAQAAAGLVKASKSIWKNVDEYRDTDELDWTKMTLDLATVGSVFAPIPASQTRNTIKGIEAVQDDPDAGAVDYARMALYGPPKK